MKDLKGNHDAIQTILFMLLCSMLIGFYAPYVVSLQTHFNDLKALWDAILLIGGFW